LFVTIDELQTYADNILEHWNSQLADKSDHVTKGLQKLHIKEEPSHDRQWKFNKTDNGLIKYSNPMDAAGETMRRLSGSATILRRESL
jgi:hypothetical protein